MRSDKYCSVHLFTTSLLAVFITVSLGASSALAANIAAPDTLTVIGHAPTAATNMTITNKTAPGLNPAIDDVLEGSYTIVDADGDAASMIHSGWQWDDDQGPIGGAHAQTFIPTTAQAGELLRVGVTPSTDPTITDPAYGVTHAYSESTLAPVLPSRTEMNAEWEPGTGSLQWEDARDACTALGLRLPTVAELQAAFVKYTRSQAVGQQGDADMHYTYNWPMRTADYPYWTSDLYQGSSYYAVYIHRGGNVDTYTNSFNTVLNYSCKK